MNTITGETFFKSHSSTLWCIRHLYKSYKTARLLYKGYTIFKKLSNLKKVIYTDNYP